MHMKLIIISFLCLITVFNSGCASYSTKDLILIAGGLALILYYKVLSPETGNKKSEPQVERPKEIVKPYNTNITSKPKTTYYQGAKKITSTIQKRKPIQSNNSEASSQKVSKIVDVAIWNYENFYYSKTIQMLSAVSVVSATSDQRILVYLYLGASYYLKGISDKAVYYFRKLLTIDKNYTPDANKFPPHMIDFFMKEAQ